METQTNPRDIYIYLPLSAAKAAQDVVVNQRQLFLPFKQPGKVKVMNSARCLFSETLCFCRVGRLFNIL